jgi:hypothetical protein
VSEGQRKNRTMNMEQTLKLSAWFHTNAEWLKGSHPSYREAADRASKDLGFAVGPSNIESVNQAMGRFYTSFRVGGIEARKEAMRKEVEDEVREATAPLLARVQELEDVVTRIAKGLGEKPPRGSGAENLRVVPPSAANRK